MKPPAAPNTVLGATDSISARPKLTSRPIEAEIGNGCRTQPVIYPTRLLDEVGTGPLPFDAGPAACGCGNPDFGAGCQECRDQHGEPVRRLVFTVWDEPVPLPRPRVAVRGGKAHGYTPTGAQAAMWRIRQQATEALGDHPRFAGPVRLSVTAWVKMPASIAKRDRATARPTRRPDLSNFVKLAEDGCDVLWQDDSQVVDLVAAKRYAVGSAPRWVIEVQEIADAR